MRKDRFLLLLVLLIILAGSLYLINKDLFHYEYIFPFSREFTPETNNKGSYLVTNQIPLKKARYELSFSGTAEKAGNNCYLMDAKDIIIFSADIPAGKLTQPFVFELPENTSVRIGFSYDPAAGRLETGQIKLYSDHVLYKDSLFRHTVFSVLVIIIFAYIGARLLKPDIHERVYKQTGIDLMICEKTFLFLAVLTILASWPFLDAGRFTEGDDMYFHLSRIEGIANSLKAGYFPPRILLGWMGNYGVGSGFYYPDLLLLFPAGLCLIGIRTVNALRTFLIVCTFLSLLTMYLAAKGLGNGSHICGGAAAILYAFAAYRLICVYYRNAVGEVQAFIFYPLILWGLISILRGETKRWKLFALGFFGMLMSHMISLAISGVLCAVCLLFFISRIIHNSRIITALVKAAAITILLGAFFLLPMVEQSLKNELAINAVMHKPLEVTKFHRMEFSNLFLLFDPWEVTQTDIIHPYPGLSLLLIPLLRLYPILRKRKDSRLPITDRILLSGLLLLIVSTDLFPWKYFNWFHSRVQFTWRFLGPAAVLLCAAGGVLFDMIRCDVQNKKAAFTVMIIAALLSGMPILIYTFSDKMYPLERLDLSNKIVSGVEYLPPNFDFLFIESNKDQVIYNKNLTIVRDSRRQKLGYVFSFENQSEGVPQDYSVPLIYYYGYEASLTDGDNVTRKISAAKDEIGLVSVSDQGLASGTIRVSYGKTTGQKLGEGISLVTLAAIIFAAFYGGMKKKRKGSAAAV